jgi:GNAT superfamily N-acetyltransferase
MTQSEISTQKDPASTSFNIRPARPTDVPGLTDVIRSIPWFEEIQRQERSQTLTQVLRQLEQCLANDDHQVYVAVSSSEKTAGDDEVLGYCSVHWEYALFHTGPDGYISELFIKDTARGQGIGSALLKTVEAEAQRRSANRLMLLNIRIRESYQRGFYAGRGWKEWIDAAPFIFRPSSGEAQPGSSGSKR